MDTPDNRHCVEMCSIARIVRFSSLPPRAGPPGFTGPPPYDGGKLKRQLAEKPDSSSEPRNLLDRLIDDPQSFISLADQPACSTEIPIRRVDLGVRPAEVAVGRIDLGVRLVDRPVRMGEQLIRGVDPGDGLAEVAVGRLNLGVGLADRLVRMGESLIRRVDPGDGLAKVAVGLGDLPIGLVQPGLDDIELLRGYGNLGIGRRDPLIRFPEPLVGGPQAFHRRVNPLDHRAAG